MSELSETRLDSRLILSAVAMLLPLALAGRAEAQRAESYEYMSASSPLKNGWTVTSQSLPGRPISTVVTPAPLTGTGNASAGVTLVPTSSQYPNPLAGGQSAVMPATPVAGGGGSWVWVPNQGTGVTPGGVPVITQPTLGITSTNALKPAGGPQPGGGVASAGANCNCGPQTGMPATAGVPPYSTGVPTVPFAPPAVLPGTIPTSATQPSGAVPANPGVTGATTAYYPYLTGNFQPIVATKNLPPGTYMGRGMFGQPTAYVDGQPMRNLFRYVFP